MTGLELHALSAMVGRQLPFFSLLVPIWLVAAQVGWRGMLEVWPACLVAGASFGAYHAMNFGLRHPDKVRRIIALSGIYNIKRFTGGYSDEHVYLNNPIELIPNEHDERRLHLLRQLDIIMATGKDDRLIDSARELSGRLWQRGIGNALREWDGWAHDWPYWEQMIRQYINGYT